MNQAHLLLSSHHVKQSALSCFPPVLASSLLTLHLCLDIQNHWVFAPLLLTFQHSYGNFSHLPHSFQPTAVQHIEGTVRLKICIHGNIYANYTLNSWCHLIVMHLSSPFNFGPTTQPWGKDYSECIFKVVFTTPLNSLIFWKYLATLVCNMFSMLQMSSSLLQPETHEKSLFYLQKLCLIHFT